MNFEYYIYKEVTFPVRVCEFTYEGKTIIRKIGSELMSELFFDENGWCDDKAKSIDDQIAYYVPHDKLLNLSDKEILDYIFYHLDEGIYDDFCY